MKVSAKLKLIKSYLGVCNDSQLGVPIVIKSGPSKPSAVAPSYKQET